MGFYTPLANRLEMMFTDIEFDAREDVKLSSQEYILLLDEIETLKIKHPFLKHFFEEETEITLSPEDRKAIKEYLRLLRWKDIHERTHLYFRGHADAISYLKKVNALSPEWR